MAPRLFMLLLQEMSVIAVLACLMGRTQAFKNALNRQTTVRDKAILVAFFGILSIIRTYTGIPVRGAIANTRAIGAISAGLLGGPVVGFLGGFIGSIHRYFIGGFTGFACGLSTTVEGLIGGIVYLRMKDAEINGTIGLFWGFTGEILQMIIILTFARPFSEALELVKIIMFPMVTVNAVDVGMFLALLRATRAEHEQIEAVQAQKALKIASRTLPYLRSGLNFESARQVAEIIKEESGVAAVALTDTEKTLELMYVCSRNGRVALKTFDKEYVTKLTLEDVEHRLGPRFLRMHRRFIVNFDRIAETIPWFSGTYVVAVKDKDGNKVPVSRLQVKELKKALGL
ncbi:MAG: LytS/YhcK type 5TM receptor domain-containing protein [Betaproteobacteria bacterium]